MIQIRIVCLSVILPKVNITIFKSKMVRLFYVAKELHISDTKYLTTGAGGNALTWRDQNFEGRAKCL
jgi:hypothetical protein